MYGDWQVLNKLWNRYYISCQSLCIPRKRSRENTFSPWQIPSKSAKCNYRVNSYNHISPDSVWHSPDSNCTSQRRPFYDSFKELIFAHFYQSNTFSQPSCQLAWSCYMRYPNWTAWFLRLFRIYYKTIAYAALLLNQVNGSNQLQSSWSCHIRPVPHLLSASLSGSYEYDKWLSHLHAHP